MNSSTINWLSRAIALPLFIAIVNISTSAGAEQIDRSRSVSFGVAGDPQRGESRSRVLDSFLILKNFTLTVPVAAPELAAEDIEASSTLAPIWSNPDRHNSSTTSISKPDRKVRATSKSKSSDLR
jgi:hypothetical protein